jgi:glycosyltransferase involved in cell wall biosynthesis
MSPEPLPRVTVIMPTLNAAGVLEVCLRALRAQDYPASQMEILVADGGSQDRTREIARSFGAVVLDNPRRIAEQGKRLALAAATGEMVFFLDADNEISHPDYLRLAVVGLHANPQALGVESYYPVSPRMGSFCGYLNATLHIGDPISWLMSINPVQLGVSDDVERWGYPGDRLAYPLGANGFLFRKADLDAVGAREAFEDTHVVLRLVHSGRREWLRIRGRGVHHYLVKGIGDFIRKRRRQAYHHLSLRQKHPNTWTSQQPQTSPLLACLYCATFIGPLFHTIRGLLRTGDRLWLWHPVACCASLFGLAWGVVTYAISPRTADAEASLQPVQRV